MKLHTGPTARLRRGSHVRRTIPLRQADKVSVDDVTAVVRRDFATCREAVAHQRHRSLRDGWGALTIAVVLLIVVVSVAEGIARMMPATRGTAAIVEGLTIAGWVALWRPLELLLYDPWTARRDMALFRRLERADVCIVVQD